MTPTKTIAFLCLFAFMASTLSGCYTTKVSAPVDSDVQLASRKENLPSVESTKNWYLLFGLVPLTNEATSNVSGYDKVRVETKWTFLDGLVNAVASAFLLGLVQVNTTVIHGAQESSASSPDAGDKATSSAENSNEVNSEQK